MRLPRYLEEGPSASVYLVDTAEKFGGAVSGLAVEGFAVDPGVHLFDSIPRDFADFLDGIAAGGMKEIAVKSASTFNGVKTDGFSLPDLSTLSPEVKAKIKAELLDDSLVNRKVDDSLNGLFQERFGSTVSDVYSAIYRHIYSIQSLEVSRDAVHSTSLHRLKFDTDEEMIDLKNRSARLDNALAARRASRDTSSESSVTVYPSDGRGMAGLNQDIQRWLAEAGVKICLGVSISAVEKVGSVESKVICLTTKQLQLIESFGAQITSNLFLICVIKDIRHYLNTCITHRWFWLYWSVKKVLFSRLHIHAEL